MTKLNDTHRILLAAAGQRDNASLLPLPASLTANARTTKALAALVTFSFAEERETTDAAAIHRIDGDLRFGLFATSSGLAAIGIDVDEAGGRPTIDAEVDGIAPSLARPTKQADVLALLGRDSGATLADLIAATGWLPHTTRAALTGLAFLSPQITDAILTGMIAADLDVATITGPGAVVPLWKAQADQWRTRGLGSDRPA